MKYFSTRSGCSLRSGVQIRDDDALGQSAGQLLVHHCPIALHDDEPARRVAHRPAQLLGELLPAVSRGASDYGMNLS